MSARPLFLDILAAAAPGGVDPEVDPDDVFDMLLGAVLTRTLLAQATSRSRPIERTVEMVVRMLRPDGPTRAGLGPGGASAGTQNQGDP